VRVEVLLGYGDAPAVRIRVELRGPVTTVPTAGQRAPDFIFANAADYGYALVHLDSRTIGWLENHIGEVRDDFLRAMLWGALWDQVRDARLAPARFARVALRELPRETDEQLVPVILGRLSRATTAYLSRSEQERLRPELERVLLADPRVTEAVVVRKPDAQWGEVPVAFVARSDEALSADALLALCRTQLAGFKRPKEIHFVPFEQFPRSTTGKVQRGEVERWLR